jgi:hypothetical protein
MPTPDPRADALAQLNESAASPDARWTLDGTYPFGQAPVIRYRLGNGLTLLFLEDTSAPVVSYFT